jgi:hypothetical protein
MAIKRERFKNHEKFKDIAAGIQSYAIVVGVLIGGLWALYTFISLRTKEKAAAELHQFELRERDFERINREQGVINIEIDAEQVSIPNDSGRNIKVNIQVKNLGNRNLKIDLGDRALAIARVQLEVQPDEEARLPTDKARLRIEGLTVSPIPYLNISKLNEPNGYVTAQSFELLRAGQTVSFPAWLRVEKEGLYLIDFEAALTGQDLEVTQKAFGDPGQATFHSNGQTFIVVK